MKTLSGVQLEQITELGEVVDKEFANLMLKYTYFVSNEELETMYNEAMELDESGDFIQTIYDVNYHSVASDYAVLDKDTIEQAFGWYGEYTLYMDEYGQGLVVGYY